VATLLIFRRRSSHAPVSASAAYRDPTTKSAWFWRSNSNIGTSSISLQVGIHDRDEWRESTQDPLDHGGGKSTPADPADAAEAWILPPCLLQLLNGSVGRIIVHEDDFPLDIAECRTELRGERRDIFAFVKCRYDDDKLRNRSLRRPRLLRDNLLHAGPGICELTTVLYWSSCHLATFVLLALLVSHRLWASRIPAAGSIIASLASSDWGTIDKLLIVLAIAHCAFYLGIPNFSDYGEPVMPLLASNYLHGAPVYADWHAGQAVIGSNYGPYVFLTQIPVLLWYPTIAASKLIGIGFGLAALLMLFLAVRKRVGSRSDALAMCALMVALLSFELHYWFWNRPDSILIAIVSLGALLFDRARPAVCLAGLGLLAGIAINLKLFGALYLLPLALACLPLVPSWSGLIGAVAIGGGLFVAALALPFEVGSFSLQNYIANIAMMTHQGLLITAIRESLFYGLAILALPLLTWRALGASREERVMAITLAVCTVFVAVVSGCR
jgi:hypothetical protein